MDVNRISLNLKMNKSSLVFVSLAFLLFSCKPHEPQFTVNGTIQHAAGKYLKYIDMTTPGLAPDSIELDLGGHFTISQKTKEPKDYLMYLVPEQYIRITPCPNEVIELLADASNLVDSYTIKGSGESDLVSQVIKRHYQSVKIMDTLTRYYMSNQLNPNLDTIIQRLNHIRDSVFDNEKGFLTQLIHANPGSLASYIALSQKLGEHANFFTLKKDLHLFEMVDTSLMKRYDTISMAKMLDVYVQRGKMQEEHQEQNNNQSMIGTEAPEIALPNPYGDTLKLSALRGSYVLVDFWGSWCRPCRLEHPILKQTYLKFHYKGFEIYQVALERNKNDWKNTIREDRLTWRNHVSELNYMDSKVARLYHVKSLPANFLVNPEGKIVAMNLWGEELSKKLEEIYFPKPTQ